MMEEEWKVVIGYDGLYEVSNLGELRTIKDSKRYPKFMKLSQSLDKRGYPQISLYNGRTKKYKYFRVHWLVWDHFGDNKRQGRILQIDHIDKNKKNNEISNLRLLTARQNVTRIYDNKILPIGVSFHKRSKKYYAQICINTKKIHLGSFYNPIDAAMAYQKALMSV